MPVISY